MINNQFEPAATDCLVWESWNSWEARPGMNSPAKFITCFQASVVS